jgi:hypothetical protein
MERVIALLRYWFSVPFRGIVLAASLYAVRSRHRQGSEPGSIHAHRYRITPRSAHPRSCSSPATQAPKLPILHPTLRKRGSSRSKRSRGRIVCDALQGWRTVEDVNAWIGARFEYDIPRALRAVGDPANAERRLPIHAPQDFYVSPRGVCVDLARFGVETLRAVDPKSRPAYVMIEFDPVSISGNTLRRHWVVSFERNGQRFFFADSKRPGHIAGALCDHAGRSSTTTPGTAAGASSRFANGSRMNVRNVLWRPGKAAKKPGDNPSRPFHRALPRPACGGQDAGGTARSSVAETASGLLAGVHQRWPDAGLHRNG